MIKIIILSLIPLGLFGQKYILITPSQSNQVKGKYGIYSEIDPVHAPDTFYIMPERCVSDNDLIGARDMIVSYINISIVQNITPLPQVGQTVYKDSLYTSVDGLVICRQTHNMTIYKPSEVPALFSFFRENTDSLEWIPNEWVELGWFRFYEYTQYECIQKHMTLEVWTPDVTPTLWEAIGTGCDEWVQKTYSIDDCVTFNGVEYTSLINNNSWSPTAYPQGWFTDECLPYVVSVYNLNECIIFNGNTYISLINNNSWTPMTYPAGWSKQ